MVEFYADLVGAPVAAVCCSSCGVLYWTADHLSVFSQPGITTGSTREDKVSRKVFSGGYIGVVNPINRVRVRIPPYCYFVLDYYRDDEMA